MSSSRTPSFAHKAARYDELRPADENWWEIADALAREGDLRGWRVLDVGCGTGRLTAALAERSKVWGVDPSPEMLAVARKRVPSGVGLKVGRAEDLPFRDASFDRAVLWLVVHLVDRPRAFAEVHRVLRPGGRVAIGTFDPAHFDAYWLNRFFPSLERIDRARFPTPDELGGELVEAGFAQPRLLNLSQENEHSRDEALERVRGRHISTLDLVPEDEYSAGLARAERELPERVDYRLEWLVAVADRG
jgi:ubiquinone/menaquinone biosynthesis C-methylase UbiE